VPGSALQLDRKPSRQSSMTTMGAPWAPLPGASDTRLI
jgi:hypothetical protein